MKGKKMTTSYCLAAVERFPKQISWLRRILLLSTGALIGGGILGLSTPAPAQTISPSALRAKSNFSALPTVVVTARKRSEKIQSIPETVEAFGSQQIANAHITQIVDLSNLVSNLNITTRADQTPDVVLRGVGSYGIVQGVGFYSDDVQLFDGQTVRPEDLDRIEVLKGPQGTLYGGSNIGGAIKYITKLPTDFLQAEAGAEYGNYDTKTFSAAVSGPIVASLLDARLSAYDSTSAGWIQDTYLDTKLNDYEERGGRLTLLYKPPGTTVKLYLSGEQYRGNSSSVYFRPLGVTGYSLTNTNGTLPEFRRNLAAATLNIDHPLSDDLDLTSISSAFHSYEYTLSDVDKKPPAFVIGINKDSRDVYSQEFRLSNQNGPLKWLVGAYLGVNHPNEINASPNCVAPGPPCPASDTNPADFATTVDTQRGGQNSTAGDEEYAIFGDATYDWNKWAAEVGLRADYDHSSMSENFVAPANFNQESPTYVSGTFNQSGSTQGRQLLPKFSLSYNFTKDIMGYTTISRGFEPGAVEEVFNPTTGDASPFKAYKPESTWNYEGGIKSTLFDRVRLNADVFYVNYKDRLYQYNFLTPGGFTQITENLGSSTNYGVEADLTARLIDRLVLTVSAGATRAVWDNLPYQDPDIQAATGCDPTVPTCGLINLKGRTPPFTPAYSGSVTLDWSHDLTDNLTFGLRGSVAETGQSYWDVDDLYRQDTYTIVNVGTRLEGTNWTLAFNVRNLFNRLYYTALGTAAENGFPPPNNVGSVSEPRLWTVSLNYKY